MKAFYSPVYTNRRLHTSALSWSKIDWKQEVVFAYLCSNHRGAGKVMRCPVCARSRMVSITDKIFALPGKGAWKELKEQECDVK